jgi:hypothetical protein
MFEMEREVFYRTTETSIVTAIMIIKKPRGAK